MKAGGLQRRKTVAALHVTSPPLTMTKQRISCQLLNRLMTEV